jgi:hypothetical protein
MSIVLEKTWTVTEFNTSSSTYNDTMLEIKTQLIAGAWDVELSCNGDGVAEPSDDDQWIDVGDLVWEAAASNHSWIVLSNSSLISSGAKFQVCFDCCNASTALGTIAVSYNAGFTGGTKTARPTATDEIVLVNNDRLFYGHGTRVFKSTDGECTRIIGVSGGYSAWHMGFEKLKNAPSWVTYPVISYCQTSTGAPANGYFAPTSFVSLQVAPTGATMKTYLDGISVTLIGLFASYYDATGTTKAYMADRYGNQNNYGGGWAALPLYFVANTYSRAGVYGCLYDLYIIPPTPEGNYLPSSTSSKGLYVYGYQGTGLSFAIGSDGASLGM